MKRGVNRLDALGMIEVNSIAAGFGIADVMMKTADVRLVSAQPICCGKYMIIVQGGVSEVKSSVESGREMAGSSLVDSFVIANIHPQVFKALSCSTEMQGTNAIGVFETFSLAACIVTSDAAVKAADVDLLEIRLGRGMGGKSFVVMTGDVSAVKHAVEAGTKQQDLNGMITNTVVIPSPHSDFIKAVL